MVGGKHSHSNLLTSLLSHSCPLLLSHPYTPNSPSFFGLKRSKLALTTTKVGAPLAREARKNGKGPFPIPTVLEDGIDLTIPSRENGREIPCRLMFPQSRKSEEERKGTRGVVLHIHGGGWVVSSSFFCFVLFRTVWRTKMRDKSGSEGPGGGGGMRVR